MSRVNLLPPEIRQAEELRRRTTLVALVGVLVIVAVGFFYFLQVTRLGDANERLAAQEAENRGLEAQIAELQRFAEREAELERRRAVLLRVFANEVAWSGALLDVSRVIPDRAVLTSLSANLTAVAEGVEGEAPVTQLVGDIQFAGQAFDEETLAVWLTRLEQVRGWENPWLSNASETAPRSNIYTFSSSVDLSTEVVTERGRGDVRVGGEG